MLWYETVAATLVEEPHLLNRDCSPFQRDLLIRDLLADEDGYTNVDRVQMGCDTAWLVGEAVLLGQERILHRRYRPVQPGERPSRGNTAAGYREPLLAKREFYICLPVALGPRPDCVRIPLVRAALYAAARFSPVESRAYEAGTHANRPTDDALRVIAALHQ